MNSYASARLESRARGIRIRQTQQEEDVDSQSADEDDTTTPLEAYLPPIEEEQITHTFTPAAIEQLTTSLTGIDYPPEPLNTALCLQFHQPHLQQAKREWTHNMQTIQIPVLQPPPHTTLHVQGEFPAYMFIVTDSQTNIQTPSTSISPPFHRMHPTPSQEDTIRYFQLDTQQAFAFLLEGYSK